MILVDTSVWIDFFNGIANGQTDHLDHALTTETVLMGDILLAEILQGFDGESDYRKAKKALDPLECVRLGGKELAVKSASNFRQLRSRGITVRKTVDMMIATWCMKYDIPLLHRDKDFERIAEHLPLKVLPNG